MIPAIYGQMPERTSCMGSMETGGPVAADDGQTRYIKSIAKLLDANGKLIGWLYLADFKGKKQAQYVQAKRTMNGADAHALHVRFVPGTELSSLALFKGNLPKGVHAARCLDVTDNGNN